MKLNRLIIFTVLVVIQLFFPIKMIWEQEAIIKHGVLYKFKTKPVDPSDPIRGKYISLDFEADTLTGYDIKYWETHKNLAYAIMENDELGFAKVKSLSKTEPTDTDCFLKVKIYFLYQKDNKRLITIAYPFDKFYMEESKALPAEQLYEKQSEEDVTYATVFIKNGNAVLTNVYINDKPIAELVKQNKTP